LKLNGGSQKYPYAIEEGYTTAEVSLKTKEYRAFCLSCSSAKRRPTFRRPTPTAPFRHLTNKNGSSCEGRLDRHRIGGRDPVDGSCEHEIRQVRDQGEFGDAVSIYNLSDIDFNRGTDEAYDDDTLTVVAAQTVTSGGNTDIASLGLRITGGSGTIGMTTGDTATFQVQPPFTKSTTVRIGGGSDTFPEFGLLVVAKQRSNGEMAEVDLFRCKASGMPIGFESNAFSEGEVKAEAFFDSAKNGVFDLDWVQPS
jgi:hypothetical protein